MIISESTILGPMLWSTYSQRLKVPGKSENLMLAVNTGKRIFSWLHPCLSITVYKGEAVMTNCPLDSLCLRLSLKIQLLSSSVLSSLFGCHLSASLGRSTVLNKYINNVNTLRGDQNRFLLAFASFSYLLSL